MARGGDVRRLRIVSEPVTEYVRYEYEMTPVANLAARSITLKVKYADFTVKTRQLKLPEPVAATGQRSMQQAIAEMPQQAGRVIGERLRQRHRLTAHEAPFMKQNAGGIFPVASTSMPAENGPIKASR